MGILLGYFLNIQLGEAEAGSQETPKMSRPETTWSASTVVRRATSSSTAEQPPRMGEQAMAGEEGEDDDDEEGGEEDVGGSFMANKNIYCNKLSNPDRLDALEGIEHDDNE